MARNTNSGNRTSRVRDEEAIVDMYFKGYTQKEINEHFNFTSGVVSSVLRRYKLRHSDRPLTKEQIEVEMRYADKPKIKSLYRRAHWSIPDIATEVNLMEDTIKAVLAEED